MGSNQTLHLSFSEGCCTMQLSIQERKSGFGESGRKVAAVTNEWHLAGFLVWGCFSPICSPTS